MRYRPASIILICSLIAAFLFWAAPGRCASPLDSLLLVTEDFPPYNYARDGEAAGLSTEVLLAMLKSLGSSLGRADIKILPWARGYWFLQERPNTLLYSVTRTPERERLFKWVGPIAQNKNVLLARKDRHIVLGSLEEAKAFRIGAVRDDAGGQLLMAAGIGNETLDVSGDPRANMLKLARNRIDLFAYPETVAQWICKAEGLSPDDFESVYVLHQGELYFALNKKTPEAIVRTLQEALDGLKQRGEIDTILKAGSR